MIDNKWVLPKNLHDCFFELIYLRKLTFVWIFILKNLHLCLLDFQKQSILVFCTRVLLPKRFWAYFWLVKDEWISFGVSQKNGMGYVHSYFLTWKILDCNLNKYSHYWLNIQVPVLQPHFGIYMYLLIMNNRLCCFQTLTFPLILYCINFFWLFQENGMSYVYRYFLTWKILDCNPYKYSRHVRNRLYPLQRIHLCICIHLLNINNRLRCFQLQHFQLYCCTFLVVAGSISLRGMVLCLTPIFLCGRKVRCVPSNAS